jgi:hypothetical protein
MLALLAFGGCASRDDFVPTPLPPRTFFMGFSSIPPRFDSTLVVPVVQMWSTRADAGLILNEPPWDYLLAGGDAALAVRTLTLPLAQFYRGLGLKVIVSVDPTNGLDRSADSAPLVAAGRSLTEPAVRAVYRSYVAAMDTIVRPEYLGIASETNLIRAVAPAALYQALVTAADSAAQVVRANDATVKLFTTVQVEVAWGRLTGTGAFEGVAQDRTDFPYIQVLGLSSYPYLAGFVDPDSLPADYYSRLTSGAAIPEMVIEGGWTSVSFGGIISSQDKQRRYITKQMALLDQAQAIGVFQITFTDLDLSAFPPPTNTQLIPFAYNGLVDAQLRRKTALSSWDAAFLRPYRP